MARAGQFQEVFRRPYQQKQSQKRTHLQLQLRIRLQRHQRPFLHRSRCVAVDRTVSRPYAIDAPRGAAFWQVALGSCTESRAFLRGAGHFRERGAVAASLSFPRLSPQPPTNLRRTVSNGKRRPGRRENTRDTLHGLLLAPLTVAVGTVPIPRRRRRDLPQLWRRQRRDQITPTHVRVPPMVGDARPVGAGAP